MTIAAKIFEFDPENLDPWVSILRNGGLVAVPTETVYGLAGNSLCEATVRNIFNVKGRPFIDPLISHFSSASRAFEHTLANTSARKLAAAFWPGPLTLVLPKHSTIPDLVTAGLPSAAIRVPGHPILLQLLKQIDFPLAAPSANPFGYVSPTRADHIIPTLGHKIEAILDGGPCQHGIESTIVDLRNEREIQILRPGPISQEELSTVLETTISTSTPKAGAAQETAQSAPGLLFKHYSPRAQIEILPNGFNLSANKKAYSNRKTAKILNSKPKFIDGKETDLFWLSEDGNLDTIAHNFFHLIQICEQQDYERLIIEAAPNTAIGIAINDRLRRAAAP